MTRPSNLAARLVFGALLFAGCAGGEPAEKGARPAGTLDPARRDVGEVVATVGASAVGVDDFRAEASRRPPADGTALSAEERKKVIDELVEQEILFQEALDKGLYHDTKVKKILVNLLLRSEVYDAVEKQDFTDADLEAYFEAHREEFVVPEKIQLRRILFKVSPDRDDAATKALAERTYADVRRDPKQFAEIAAQRSEGPYQRRGGDLGFIARDGKPGVDPEVVAKGFELAVDEITPPIRFGDTWQILMVANRRERVERSFQQMRGSVLRMVKQQRFKEQTERYIADARARYPVKVDEAKVASIELQRAPLRERAELMPPGVESDEPAP